MGGADDTYTCDACGATTSRSEALRRETMGGLDPDRWQTLCCPDCGGRLKTVLIGE
jgi:predicted RNA-binding Zn-ribbon protein involved in translation (DUF1610 family)